MFFLFPHKPIDKKTLFLAVQSFKFSEISTAAEMFDKIRQGRNVLFRSSRMTR